MKIALTLALVLGLSGCIPIGFKAQNLPLTQSEPAPRVGSSQVTVGVVSR